jgi:hypothetical protein
MVMGLFFFAFLLCVSYMSLSILLVLGAIEKISNQATMSQNSRAVMHVL